MRDSFCRVALLSLCLFFVFGLVAAPASVAAASPIHDSDRISEHYQNNNSDLVTAHAGALTDGIEIEVPSILLQSGDDRLDNETGGEGNGTSEDEISGEAVDGEDLSSGGDPNGGVTGGNADDVSDGGGGDDLPSFVGGGPGASENESANATGNETANATANESANETGSPGMGNDYGGDGGGFGPSPLEWVVEAAVGLFNIALSEIGDVITHYQEEGIGLPAPGEPGDWGSWTEDLEGWFAAAEWAYFISAFLGSVYLISEFVNASAKGAAERRQRYHRIGIAFTMILLGRDLVLPASLHFFNELALIIGPTGEDFTASFGNMARLGWGFVFGGLLVIASSFTFVLGLFMIEATDIFVYVIYGTWGLIWAGWASKGQPRAYGYQGLFTLGALFVLVFSQALILGMVFRIPWADDLYSPAQVLIGTSIGLGIAYVYLPLAFVKQTIHGAATALGTGAALTSSQIDSVIEEQVYERVEQFREEQTTEAGGHPDETGGGSGTGPSRGTVAADGGADTEGRPSDESGSSEVDQERDRVNYHYN